MTAPSRRHRAGWLHDHQTKAPHMTTTATLTARMECLPNDVLVNVLRGLMYDFRPEADIVTDEALRILRDRLPSAEFIQVCGELTEAA